MRNSKRFIHILSIFFSFAFYMICVFGTASTAGIVMGVHHSYKESHIKDNKIEESINSTDLEKKVISANTYKNEFGNNMFHTLTESFKIINIKQKEGRIKLTYILNMILSIIFVLLFTLEFKRILKKLDQSLQKEMWFSESIYKALIRLVYYMIGIILIKSSFEIYYCFINDRTITNGAVFPYYDYIGLFMKTSIIFVIAAIYKSGLQLREEQELTI